MISGSVTFDLYSSDRFDCFAVRFQFSDIYFYSCRCWFSLSLFLILLFPFYKSAVCVFVWEYISSPKLNYAS